MKIPPIIGLNTKGVWKKNTKKSDEIPKPTPPIPNDSVSFSGSQERIAQKARENRQSKILKAKRQEIIKKNKLSGKVYLVFFLQTLYTVP